MKWREYVKGLAGWTLFVSFCLFWFIWMGSEQADKQYIVIGTGRLLGLMILANALLTAVLVNLSTRDWREE